MALPPFSITTASGSEPSGERDVLADPLDEMGPRRSGLERVGEILGFARHQSVAEFHDAHRVGRGAVVTQNEFGDPEIAAPDNAPDREMLGVRLGASAF